MKEHNIKKLESITIHLMDNSFDPIIYNKEEVVDYYISENKNVIQIVTSDAKIKTYINVSYEIKFKNKEILKYDC